MANETTGRCLSIRYSLLLLLECLLFFSVETERTVAVGRNTPYGCKKSHNLYSQEDSYKLVFFNSDVNCRFRDRECSQTRGNDWTCQISFFSDSFSQDLYEICLDVLQLKVRDCRNSSVIYSPSEFMSLNGCNRQETRVCSEEASKVVMRFKTNCPSCDFLGHIRVYLRPKSPSIYVLFKEGRTSCFGQYHTLSDDNGWIVSEFHYHNQNRTDFCPVLIRVSKSTIYKKFCIKFEVAKFIGSNFAILVESQDQQKRWSFGYSTTETGKEYCDDVRPDGYTVSAVLPSSMHNSRFDHRIRLSYSYEPEDEPDYENSTEDEEDEDDDKKYVSHLALTLGAVLCCVIVIVCFICCVFKRLLKRRRSRERQAATNASISQLGITHSSTPNGSGNQNSAPPIIPTAPLMNGAAGSSGADQPPSYESLFPSK